jgi:CIC family chloride channel protein
MIFEMSLQSQVILPLMVATVIAYATARSLSGKSLYSASLLHGARGVLDRPLGEIKVGDLMHAKAVSIVPRATFVEVARAFLKEPRHELWVASPNGFVGCIRLDEVGPFLNDAENAETVLASDIVSEDVPRLATDMPVTEAFKLFADSPLSRLPVLDAQGTLVGEVSRSDIFLTISEIARRG